MKRWLSVLFVVAMVLGLCAMGGPARAAEEEGSEKVYVHGEKQVLLRKTIRGDSLPNAYNPVSGRVFDVVTEYVYDDYGELTEEKESLVYPNDMDHLFTDGKSKEFENYTYVYDAEGNVESVTTTVNMTYNGTIQTQDQYLFEDGRIVRQQAVLSSGGKASEEINYIYGSDGQVVRQEHIYYAELLYNEWFPVPVTVVHEFDEDGYCTRWTETRDGNESTMEYSYDADKNLIRTAHSVNGEIDELNEIRYADGVQTELTCSKDGETVVYSFAYDEEGRPSSLSYDVNGNHTEVLYSYYEDGYLSEADWVQNGSPIGKTTYSYTEEEDGDVNCTINGNLGPFVFGGSRTQGSFSHSYYRGEEPSLIYDYTLKPVLNSIQYLRTTTDYDRSNIDVLIEVARSGYQTDASVEDFYPILKESYGGIPVPTPDGTQRLVKITRSDYNYLPVVAEFSYDEDGNLAGVVTYFDGVGAYEMFKWSEDAEADEQGRVIRRVDKDRDLTIEYVYGEDGTSFKVTRSYGDNNPYEREFTLAENQISDLVRMTPEEVLPYGSFEYNEDGLPIHSTAVMNYASGETETREKSYTYSFETWPDGSLKNVLRREKEDNYDISVYSFDEHGYLTDYYCYYNPSPSMPFSYEYEAIG